MNVPLSGSLQQLQVRAQRRWQRWINRRIPPARTITLDQKRIFIFPSRVGMFFLLTLLVMLIAAINYQNNMTFALTFLLANLFVVAVLHTFSNLSGLTVQAVRAHPVFAGQKAEFEVLLSRRGKRRHQSLRLKWNDSDAVTVSLETAMEQSVKLFVPTHDRGWHTPGRLLIETHYPLGILRAWTWVDLDIRALVYPRPVTSGPLPGIASDRPEGTSIPVPGKDDFHGLRDYQPRDSLRHVHWRSLAKGQPLQTKQFTAYADTSVWLDWNMFEGLPGEQRLSHLCYWALEYDQSNEEYGLRLPGVSVSPALSDAHRQQVLRELALCGVVDEA
jgi:uncharacterized protein (DUF58 family)